MMKILCPVDFSPAANNAIEYAARLAQKMNASLTLLNVQWLFLKEQVSLTAGDPENSETSVKQTEQALLTVCDEIQKTFRITCNSEIISSVEIFQNIIAEEAGKFNLTVIGTNGADNTYEFFFGSHSFRVAKNTSSPVIIVPEEYAYEEIQNIVFASDYNKGEELLLQQLKQFTASFNPQLHVLHISKKDTELSREIFRVFSGITEEEFKFDNRIQFSRIVDEDAAIAVDKYMSENNANLLAICYQPHGFLYRMFHENLIKSITSYADYPVMILHK
jgi:nucleotide-binding universal stress UspA family protein